MSERKGNEVLARAILIGFFLGMSALLFFALFIYPEFAAWRARGFLPPDAAAGHRSWSVTLNPFLNPLVRFFLGTSILGALLDQARHYADGSGS